MAHHEEPVTRFPAAGGMTDEEISAAEQDYENEQAEESYLRWMLRRVFGLPDDCPNVGTIDLF